MNGKNILGMILIFLVSFSFVVAQDSSEVEESISKVLISDKVFKQDPYNLRGVRIEKDILKLDVSYGGGCRQHSFVLIWDGAFTGPTPAETDLFLYHDGNNDMCEAFITETLQYDLAPIKEAYQDAYGAVGKVVINVYDSDDTRHTVTYNIREEPSTVVIYVKLGEKFSLAEGQEADVTDYDYMKIRINRFIIDHEISPEVEVDVTMPCKDPYGCVAGKRLVMKQGTSENVFGARLTFLNTIVGESGDSETRPRRAVFVVEKEPVRKFVDVEIFPEEQSIFPDGKAVYTVEVTDAHPVPGYFPDKDRVEPYIYNIHVDGMPFLKYCPQEIKVSPGEATKFELVIKPYEAITEAHEAVTESGVVYPVTEAHEAVTESGVVYPVTEAHEAVTESGAVYPVTEAHEAVTESGVVYPVTEVQEGVTGTESGEIYYVGRYPFTVTASLKGNDDVRDTAKAILAIKPFPGPTPPPIPGNEVSIELSEGWNLISLPGELVRFDEESLLNDLIVFVYIKEEQRYVTLDEAEKMMGERLMEYLAKNAFWVYTNTPSTLNFWVDRKTSYRGLELVKGWNFVPVTEDMLGSRLADILENCDVGKLYTWDAKSQMWESITMDYSFADYQVSHGFLVEAKNDCRLGGLGIRTVPPSMPEEQSFKDLPS